MIKINNSALGEKCTVHCKYVKFTGPVNFSHKLKESESSEDVRTDDRL
jgi:hypothetical protein